MDVPNLPGGLEKAFLKRADALPMSKAEVSRTDQGALCVFWKAPCEYLGGLWLYVSEDEITLGTKTFHTHHCSIDYLTERLGETELYERIIEHAMEDALAIMKGEKVFSTSYDAAGNATSYGMRPLIQSDEAKEHHERVKEQLPKMYAHEREWTWTGEITA